MSKQLLHQRVKWISVEDRLPKKDEDWSYLVYKKSIFLAVFDENGKKEWWEEGDSLCTPIEGITHWMKLPKEP